MNEPTKKYIVTKYACSGQVEIVDLYEDDGGEYLCGGKNAYSWFMPKRACVCHKTRKGAVASVEKLFYKRRRSLEKSLEQLDERRKKVIATIKSMTEMPE